MKIDFHTHGKLAKKLEFSKEYTDWLFNEAKLSGLDAICLTEHFNTLEFEGLYEYIRNTYIQSGDAYITPSGLKIFAGMEVDVLEGGHTLLVGKYDDILELNKKLENNKKKDSFIRAEELVDLISNYDVIFGAAHPFRDGSNIKNFDMKVLKRFDFVDINGKDTGKNNGLVSSKLSEFSERIDVVMLAGSDTHQSFQYGSVYNVFYKDCNTINELKKIIKNEEFTVFISENIGFKIRAAEILKKALKEIDVMGGDYVKVLIND